MPTQLNEVINFANLHKKNDGNLALIKLQGFIDQNIAVLSGSIFE